MAEDTAELALEAVDPLMNHSEMWQKAKNKAKSRLPVLHNAEEPQRRVESNDQQTQYRDKDKRGSSYGKPNRRQSQDDFDLDHRTVNAPSNHRQSRRPNSGRPRIQRRASSLDRGEFDRSRGRRKRDPEGENRAGHEGNTSRRRASQQIDGKDALAAGVTGIAALYLGLGLYKDFKNKDIRRGRDAA